MDTEMTCAVREDEKDRDEETEVMLKRSRRRSDVIDSIGERDDEFPPGLSTPRATETDNDVFYESPEQDAVGTPESVNVFKPAWLTQLDAGVSLPSSQEEKNISEPRTTSGLSAKMTVARDAEHYNMSHKHRGKCIIFNHEIFDTGFEPRDGSTIDAKRIDKTFSNLGFEVEILENLEHTKVIEKINELSAEDHSDRDCLCVFMLTHGLAPDMIFAKDVAYQAEKIWKPFTADQCTTLLGKPKLFFFQACRGNALDPGVKLMHRQLDSLRTEVDSTTTSYKLPTHADFLIAHSTVQGHYSWRSTTTGTWFIQCLCNVIDEHHQTTDLQKMLTICSRRVATDFASYNDLNPTKHDQKQVPSITSMLIRDLYFTPK